MHKYKKIFLINPEMLWMNQCKVVEDWFPLVSKIFKTSQVPSCNFSTFNHNNDLTYIFNEWILNKSNGDKK